MPRYVIERYFAHITDEDMLAATIRSDDIAADRFPDITWEHSHVVVDDEGAVTTFCVYEAQSEESIREHAEAFGMHTIVRMAEIVEDVTPELVRQRAAAAKT